MKTKTNTSEPVSATTTNSKVTQAAIRRKQAIEEFFSNLPLLELIVMDAIRNKREALEAHSRR